MTQVVHMRLSETSDAYLFGGEQPSAVSGGKSQEIERA